MRSNLYLLGLILITSCASRGYKSLHQDVPELFFKDFKEENYIKKETPKNVIYVEKVLPEEEKNKEEFIGDHYQANTESKTYGFYIPNSRIPGKRFDLSIIKGFPVIKTTKDLYKKAILID